MKKLKLGDPELPKILINKMLEKHNVDYDYVIANPEIDGRVWCVHYSWTQEESDEYQKWWFDFYKNNVAPKYSKKYLEKSWPWFNLQYGLRIKED